MNGLQGVLTVVARLMLSLIFIMSAIGNKIPHFAEVADHMQEAGIPAPKFMLVGAIAFLLVGSASVVVGYKARLGASMLFIFLVLATYFFHDFWTFESGSKEFQQQIIQFMKNLSLMGAMLFVVANGSGRMSLDRKIRKAPDDTD